MAKSALPLADLFRRRRRSREESSRLSSTSDELSMHKRRLPSEAVSNTSGASTHEASGESISYDALKRGVESWLTQCELRKMSAATLGSRRFVTSKLFWLMERDDLSVCDRTVVERFLAYAGGEHLEGEPRWGNTFNKIQTRRANKPETGSTYHRILRTAFWWLVEEEYLTVSPVERIKPPVVRADQVIPLSKDQIEQLLGAAAQSEYPKRNRAIVLLILDTGIRASELVPFARGISTAIPAGLSFTAKGTRSALCISAQRQRGLLRPISESMRGRTLIHSSTPNVVQERVEL